MFLIDLLFPKFCLGCGYIGAYICEECINKLKPIEHDTCLYCKKPSLFGLTHPNCQNKLNIDGFIAIYHYNPILKKIIKNIKYRLTTEVWKEFTQNIRPTLINKLSLYNSLSSKFVIQPIPLTKNKFNARGFNQANLISYFFTKFLHYPVIDCLIRNSEKSPQAQLKNLKNRYLNVKGVFDLNFKCRDEINHVSTNVILIDDVVTSGSTVKEAGKILKLAGAKKVFVLALAKG